jgi:hypothetical protein
VNILADIAHGHVDGADFFLLAAVIAAVIAAICYAMANPKASRFAPVLLSLAVAFAAMAWLIL